MTSTEHTPMPDTPGEPVRPTSWSDIAADFAYQMTLPSFSRGDLAELRRMNPDSPGAPVFWRLLASRDLLGYSNSIPIIEDKWALILHGIALMTRNRTGEPGVGSAHAGNMPVGRALYLGGESTRSTAFFSELRFNRLLAARGPMLHTLLARMFRTVAAADQPFNWREMARFIRSIDYREDLAERARRGFARAYYRAERQDST